MRRRLAEFVGDKLCNESIAKAHRILRGRHPLGDGLALPRRRLVAPPHETIEVVDPSFIEKPTNECAHFLVQGTAARYDDPDRDCAVRV